jgi:hypothetical protein
MILLKTATSHSTKKAKSNTIFSFNVIKNGTLLVDNNKNLPV